MEGLAALPFELEDYARDSFSGKGRLQAFLEENPGLGQEGEAQGLQSLAAFFPHFKLQGRP